MAEPERSCGTASCSSSMPALQDKTAQGFRQWEVQSVSRHRQLLQHQWGCAPELRSGSNFDDINADTALRWVPAILRVTAQQACTGTRLHEQ
jgi:hypothetical protein